MKGDAILSACGRYRYWLRRQLSISAFGGTCCFIMLNPSTADAEKDDPTIRKCMGFATRWGFGELVVINLFAYRATSPKELLRATMLAAFDAKGLEPTPDNLRLTLSKRGIVPVRLVDPVNDEHIERAVTTSDEVVLAWGGHGEILNRSRDVLQAFGDRVWTMKAFRRSENTEQPVHPLYQKNDAKLYTWRELTVRADLPFLSAPEASVR